MSNYLSPKLVQLYEAATQCEEKKQFSFDLSVLEEDEAFLVRELQIDASAPYEKRDFAWYESALRRLSPFFSWCQEACSTSELLRGATPSWLSHGGVYEAVVVDDTLSTREALTILVPLVERSLGDVFHSRCRTRPVPPLMRDLVTSEELTDLLGSDLSTLFQVFFGSPRSLNLRNVLWHGFLSDDECLNPCLLATLTTAFHLTDKRLGLNEMRVRRRRLAKIQPLRRELLDLALPLSALERLGDYRHPVWSRALMLLKRGKPLVSVCLLVTELESSLRGLFVKANCCPSRLLTAETTTFYTTFTEMFAQHYVDEEEGTEGENRLLEVLGVPMTTLFFDLFVLPEGPRLRDRLSHGELELSEASEALGDWSRLLLSFLGAVLELRLNVPKTCLITLGAHKSAFHPSAFLKRGLVLAEERIRKMVEEVSASSERFLLRELELEGQVDLVNLQRQLEASEVQQSIRKMHSETLFRPAEELEKVGRARKLCSEVNSFLQALEVYFSAGRKLEEEGLRSLSQRQKSSLRKGLRVLPRVLRLCLEALALCASDRCGGEGGSRRLGTLFEKATSLLRKGNKWDEVGGAADAIQEELNDIE